MPAAPIKVLIIEDDLDYVEIVRLCLEEPEAMGLAFELESATRLAEGLLKLSTRRYDVALVDLTLPDARGLEAIAAVLGAAPDMPTLVSTNMGDESTALEAMRLGAQDFMIKASSDSRMLKRAIRYAIERKAALAQRDQIIRSAADGMVVVDSTGVVQFANAAAEKILGAAAGEVTGRAFPYKASPGETTVFELHRQHAPPSVVEMRVTEVPWTGGPASLASLRDITELRRIERWKSEVAERRKADQMKDRWIETVSHELRTPLSILKIAVYTLGDQPTAKALPPELATTVSMARRQIERIEHMIVNLLDLSRMESGRVKADRKPVEAVAVLRRVAGDFGPVAEARALKLETGFERESQQISADPELFEQLVVNLVDNAMRFARSRVDLGCRCVSGWFEVSVHDDGPGIPPERRELLFTRFSQLERKRAADGYRGTGLGLAICKEIVALHGGHIEVESKPGEGTLFRVSLPPDGAPAPSAPDTRAAKA